MAASPTGNSGDAASASTVASTAPAEPISAARISPAAVSWAGLIPTARNAPKLADSKTVSRASNWPKISSPSTASSPASSHSATACR